MVVESWGRFPRLDQQASTLSWRHDSLPRPAGQSVLPHGLGRSYGDSCLNDGHTLLMTRALDHYLELDTARGTLRAESGVVLGDILREVLPHGWFLPVVPGTQFVTLGGAIASDIHGKNHHRSGSFGLYVTRFELLRSDGERLLCSREQNAELFRATLGGLGLTGLITWAEIQLLKVPGARVDVENIRFRGYSEFFSLSRDSEEKWDYTVAWVDCLRGTPRGIFSRGNHAAGALPKVVGQIPVPCEAPEFLLNDLSMKLFNTAYYRRPLGGAKSVSYEPFFFPLDRLAHWNRMYGKRGFLQYQFVVPLVDGEKLLAEILSRAARRGFHPYLTVLKTFGNRASEGLLSFPRPGVTFALDFANRGPELWAALDEMDQLVVEAGGAIYTAKDARMSPAVFRKSYPRWQQLEKWRDPAFSSTFWRRVTAGEKK